MKTKDLVIPMKLDCEQNTLTDTYGRFYAEPFEKGYGHTIGNSLRRILYSSMEGSAVAAVRIPKAPHEYTTLRGVREDVATLLMNLRAVRFKMHSDGPETLHLSVSGEKVVRAKDFEANPSVEIMNPEAPIATLEASASLEMDIWITKGRGYIPAERHSRDAYPADAILVDSLYSPVVKVHYDVENARVGQVTDYDRLLLDVWTDGSVKPGDALAFAAKILKDTLAIFITFDEEDVTAPPAAPSNSVAEAVAAAVGTDVDKLRELLGQPVDIIELSVRASNCLKAAKIRTIGDLVRKKDDELITFKNFGKKSLDEIKERLTEINLTLGMDVDAVLGKN